MSRDPNDPRQNKKLQKLWDKRDHDDDETLRVLMESPDARRVLTKLARDFGWMGDGWDATSARQTDYNAGRQSAAREMMGWAERVAPAHFMTALGEATQRDVEMTALAKAATTEKEQDDG